MTTGRINQVANFVPDQEEGQGQSPINGPAPFTLFLVCGSLLLYQVPALS